MCNVHVVRLAGSGVNDTGRLEVYYNGQWGTVCIDDFDDNDAAVACYMLGFGYVHSKVNFGFSKTVKASYRLQFDNKPRPISSASKRYLPGLLLSLFICTL